MLVKINGRTYKVQWQYDENNVRTLCIINNENNDVVFKGQAVRKHGDIHNKSIARKQSLKSAIKPFAKVERKEFWKTLLETCK